LNPLGQWAYFFRSLQNKVVTKDRNSPNNRKDRKGHSIYFSQTLREKVNKWAQNDSVSKADIYDRALEFFFANHEITDEGVVILSEDFRRQPDSSVDECKDLLQRVLSNQEQMLERASATPLAEGELAVENKNSEEPIVPNNSGFGDSAEHPDKRNRKEYEHLAGDYQHEEVIDPESVDAPRLTKSKQYILPVFIGVLNYFREVENRERIEKSELIEIGQLTLDVSEKSVRNYLKELISRDVIIRHPSLDDDFPDEDTTKSVRKKAAVVGIDKKLLDICMSDLSETKQKRYTDDIDVYLNEYTDNWPSEEFALSLQEYHRILKDIISEVIEDVAKFNPKKRRYSRESKTSMTEKEKIASLHPIFIRFVEKLDIHKREIINKFKQAKKVSTDEELSKWSEEWNELIFEVDKELSEQYSTQTE
jgi:hypothetical protein